MDNLFWRDAELIAVGVDEGDHFVAGRSTSAAKNADAALRTSLAGVMLRVYAVLLRVGIGKGFEQPQQLQQPVELYGLSKPCPGDRSLDSLVRHALQLNHTSHVPGRLPIGWRLYPQRYIDRPLGNPGFHAPEGQKAIQAQA